MGINQIICALAVAAITCDGSAGTTDIFVRNPEGDQKAVNVYSDAKVGHLREAAAAAMDVDTGTLRFRGAELFDDEIPLADTGVCAESEVAFCPGFKIHAGLHVFMMVKPVYLAPGATVGDLKSAAKKVLDIEESQTASVSFLSKTLDRDEQKLSDIDKLFETLLGEDGERIWPGVQVTVA